MDTITLISNILATRCMHGQFLKELVCRIPVARNLPIVHRIFL